jgi:hypothetical protein
VRAILATVAAGGAALGLAAGAFAASPHARARALLLKCRNGMAALYIGPVTANTPEVPRMNQRAHAAYGKCLATGAMLDLASAHPQDAALQNAYRAYLSLGLGIGDYQQYLVNVAFDHTGMGILHRAQREIAQGRTLTKRVLPKLG